MLLLLITFGFMVSTSHARMTHNNHHFLILPRGGALFGFFRGMSVAQHYRTSLEDQITLLERQLRMAKEEALQLRKLLNVSAKTSRRQSVAETRDEQAVWKEQLSLLLAQMLDMEILQKELQTLLNDERERSTELEKQLKNEKANVEELIETHEAEMKELQKTLDNILQKQLKELRKTMDIQIKEASEKAVKETLRKGEEKMKEAVDRVQTKAQKELDLERQKSEDAVERERVKMRKLVKALADREKKLFSNHDQQERRGTVVSNMSSLASTMKQAGPNNVRSPLK